VTAAPFISLAYVDMHMREVKYTFFNDNSQLIRLESTLVQLGPKEIIYGNLEKSGGILLNLLKRLQIPFDSKNLKTIGQDNLGNLEYWEIETKNRTKNLEKKLEFLIKKI
jgi:DNA mismatch repair ATPase MutS